ncbi:hypothetical protein H6P81_015080 [Aristolochia fimbriata]|uniref:Uncharacterized protein n=1 Tax=Aristolochia fimbriata TaxID=158543 RepID=A0AAV7E6I8_ARIFI|nr:hypothetical protein H6P81_015080 [Aristolochia fimbriata]
MVWSPCVGASAGCVLLSPTAPTPALFSRSFGFDKTLRLQVPQRGIKLWNSLKLVNGNFALVYPSHHVHWLATGQHIDGNLVGSSVLLSKQTIIVGYWVGPEIEDGWGYVEAAVNLVGMTLNLIEKEIMPYVNQAVN